MNVRSEIVALGLVGLMYSGCGENTTSKVGGAFVLVKPQDCVEVRDIHYEVGTGYAAYQLLCVDVDKKLSLYQRSPRSEVWDKITVE